MAIVNIVFTKNEMVIHLKPSVNYWFQRYSINGQKTIEAKPDPNVVMGSGPTFAFEDIEVIRKYLQCDQGEIRLIE